MTKFTNKSFTVPMGGSDAYRDNYDRTFGKLDEQPDPAPLPGPAPLNRYRPYFDHDEERTEMALDEQGSWVHITTVEQIVNECAAWKALAEKNLDAQQLAQENENLRATLDAALSGRGK